MRTRTRYDLVYYIPEGSSVTFAALAPAANSFTGAVVATRALAGISPAGVDAPGAVTTTRTLAGAAPAANDALAALTVTASAGPALAGTCPAVTEATGVLFANRLFAGSLPTASAVTAAMTVTGAVTPVTVPPSIGRSSRYHLAHYISVLGAPPSGFAGTVPAAGGFRGAITNSLALSGAATAAATVTATLTIPGGGPPPDPPVHSVSRRYHLAYYIPEIPGAVNLAALAATVSDARGALSTLRPLGGQVTTASSSTSATLVSRSMAGSVVAASGATATVTTSMFATPVPWPPRPARVRVLGQSVARVGTR